METEFKKPFFSISILAGVFTGIIITLINLFYNIGYRELTGFSNGLLINVSSIIFVTMLLLLVIGCLFYVLAEYVKKGRLLFIIIILLLTILCVVLTLSLRQNAFSSGFDGLFLGLELITGISAAFLVPYFARHSEIFM